MLLEKTIRIINIPTYLLQKIGIILMVSILQSLNVILLNLIIFQYFVLIFNKIIL